jgi:CHAT domain-containing protein
VSTLWRVEDRSTAFLMGHFYENLDKGESVRDALWHAQRATQKEFPHPGFWAGFVNTGNGD